MFVFIEYLNIIPRTRVSYGKEGKNQGEIDRLMYYKLTQ